MRNYVLLAAAASAIATPAAAQEVSSFSGFRLEAVTGYDSVGIGTDEDTGVDVSGSSDGALYGIGAGYDLSLGRGIVGIEAEYTDSTTGEKETVIDPDFYGYDVNGTVSLDATSDLYLGIRGGMAVAPQVLVYAKGGYSKASAKLLAKGSVDGQQGTYKATADFDGFRLGAGAELQMADRFFAKIEYRYSNYGGGSADAEGAEYNIDEAFDYIDLDRHQVAVGVGIRF